MAHTLVVLSVVAMAVMVPRQAFGEPVQHGNQLADILVTVRLDNNAGVPDPILTFAKARAANVFQRIGVRLTWLDSTDAARLQIRPSYTMVLLAAEAGKRKAASDGLTQDVVGQAVIAGRRAYVFYERVMAMVSLPDRDIVTLLGYAMAHELGHLMLPPHSHSQIGVMRPNYDTDSRAIPSFTEAEASMIRKRLSND